MGSDHLPIHIRLLIRTLSRRQVTFTKWDSYRTAMTRLAGVPFAERIQHALKKARTEYNVKEDKPQPDLHLINLWDRRLEALMRYRTRRYLQNKIRLNHATAEATKYTIELCRTNWRKLCDSFNERIGYCAFWRAYKGLAGKTKTCNTGSNLALHLDIAEEQLATEAGDYFFPEKPEPPPTDVYVDQLESIAQMNTIRDIDDDMRVSQAQRLSRTAHGRIILTSSGRAHLINGPLMPTSTPPWNAEAVTPVKPLPSHEGPDCPERRATQAAIHNKEISQLLKHVEIFYTDAARDDSGRTAIAWHSPTRNATSNQLTSRTRSTCMAELLAILFAVETATTMPRPEISETRIYTDSQEAVRALGHSNTCNVTVAHIRELVRLAGAKQKITIAWIPGHANIPGNEWADGAARALLQASIQPSQGPVPSPVQRDVSTKEVFDLYETKKEERNARKARLAALLPANPHPIPRGLPRWERVALHRLPTRTMLTPVWLAKFHRPTDQEDTGPDQKCPHCGVPATCDHLVWFCPETSNERAAAINNLPPSLRPKTLWEWTHPRSSEPADRTAVFSSIITYLRSSGIGQYI
ncbi:hypothetical protein HPB47_009825 [Ixodes persulcatus]|uniref:Uncharacterized protein n=1 Tax=Ixodes persulcatus TaxID=34615 RepID=A0AC60P124_IXOPE|nr:hypothetical protein HPB47_009825 [Ixodes persulcatus]